MHLLAPEPRPVDRVRRVADDLAPLDGLLQSLVQDAVNQDEGAAAHPILELLVVQGLKMIRTKTLELKPTDKGYDVLSDDLGILLVRVRPDCIIHAAQPFAQVLGHRDPSARQSHSILRLLQGGSQPCPAFRLRMKVLAEVLSLDRHPSDPQAIPAPVNTAFHYVSTEGVPHDRMVWESCLHLVNHGTQHKSEAGAMLTSLGYSPGVST